VAASNGIADADVVLFDPDLDIAVLYAPDVDAPSLDFADGAPTRGVTGAALGYANGGPLVVMPAGVTGAYPATGRDIYDEDHVTRDIIELQAPVEPGDSGGPFVLEDGTVGGIVFAESRTDDAVGYALTPDDVDERVAPAVGRTTPVDVGPCLR
jgi:S1-C subfamily serine protease